MFESSDETTLTIRITQTGLRIAFIVGCSLHVILTFAPAYSAKVGGFLGIGAEDRSFSTFDAIRAALATNAGEMAGLIGVIWFCSVLGFALLAMKRPRRWVFLAGACVASFFLILSMFAGAPPNVRVYLLPQLLRLSASLMEMTGFWIAPAQSNIRPGTPYLRTLGI